jgi:hypothetical protein
MVGGGGGRRILGEEGDFENFGTKSGKSGGEFGIRILEAELIIFLKRKVKKNKCHVVMKVG